MKCTLSDSLEWLYPDSSIAGEPVTALECDAPAGGVADVNILVTDAAPDAPLLSRPNTDLIPATADFLEETLRTSEFSGIRHALAGFLADASLLRVQQGRTEEGRALYARLEAFFASIGVAEGVPSFPAHVRAGGLRTLRRLRVESSELRDWAAQGGAPGIPPGEILAEAERLEREAAGIHARLSALLPELGDASPLPAPDAVPEDAGEEPFAELLMKAGYY